MLKGAHPDTLVQPALPLASATKRARQQSNTVTWWCPAQHVDIPCRDAHLNVGQHLQHAQAGMTGSLALTEAQQGPQSPQHQSAP